MKTLRLYGGEYSSSWDEYWHVPDTFTYGQLADRTEAISKEVQKNPHGGLFSRAQIVDIALKDIGAIEITADFEVDVDAPRSDAVWLTQLRGNGT